MTSMTLGSEVLKQDARGHVQYSAERRNLLLEEFERSGASGAKFARLAGIKYSTFAAWVKKRREAGANPKQLVCPRTSESAKPIQFLEAVVAQEPARATTGHGLLIELPGGSRLRVESPGQMQMAAEMVSLIAERSRTQC